MISGKMEQRTQEKIIHESMKMKQEQNDTISKKCFYE